jgi:hypothetical protein
VVSFTLQPLYLRRMSTWCPLNRRRGGLQSRFRPFGEETSLFTLRGIKSRSLGRPSHVSHYVDASVSRMFLPATYASLVWIRASAAKTDNRFVLDRRLVAVSMNNKCLCGWFGLLSICINLVFYVCYCYLTFQKERIHSNERESVSLLAPKEQGTGL